MLKPLLRTFARCGTTFMSQARELFGGCSEEGLRELPSYP